MFKFINVKFKTIKLQHVIRIWFGWSASGGGIASRTLRARRLELEAPNRFTGGPQAQARADKDTLNPKP